MRKFELRDEIHKRLAIRFLKNGFPAAAKIARYSDAPSQGAGELERMSEAYELPRDRKLFDESIAILRFLSCEYVTHNVLDAVYLRLKFTSLSPDEQRAFQELLN